MRLRQEYRLRPLGVEVPPPVEGVSTLRRLGWPIRPSTQIHRPPQILAPANRGRESGGGSAGVTAWGVLTATLEGTSDQLSATGQEVASLSREHRALVCGSPWAESSSGSEHSPVVLPDSGLPLPNRLWDIELGTMHLRDWQAAGKAVCSCKPVPPVIGRSSRSQSCR